MIGTDKSENKEMAPPKQISLAMLMGVFLTSLSALLLEITFTRILSVMLSYHYVFVVISMALLGLGAGGVFSYFTRSKTSFGSLPVVGGIFAFSISSSIFGVTKLGAAGVFINSMIIVVPFFFAGIILSRVFQEYASQSGKVYAADLTGAAAGALLAVPQLDRLGGINSGLVLGIFAAIASLLLVGKIKVRLWFPALSLVSATTLFLAGVYVPAFSDIVLRPDMNKELVASLANDTGSEVVATRWSSFGRTDLIKFSGTPDIMGIFVDATAGTSMYRFSGDISNPGPAVDSLKVDFPGYYPLRYLQPGQKNNALIIGPGGGRDVLVALMSGIKNITAVEVNPDTVDLVKEYADYNGGIYTNFPNVKVVVAEGRNYLRQQTEKYDIIMLSLPVTKTSRSPEGFALTENFLFTSNSIADYFDHLSDNGRLVVVAHDPLEVMRLMSLSHTALENRGMSTADVMNRIYTLGSHHRAVFVLSKGRITPEESFLAHQTLHTTNMEPLVSYLPHIKSTASDDHIQQARFDQCQMLNPVLVAMSQGYLSQHDLVKGLASRGLNVSAVTDESPFFYSVEVGIPGPLSDALTLSLLFVLATILVPYRSSRKRTERGYQSRKNYLGGMGAYPILFALLGIGFMLAEIPLIQRFTLFLGEPVLSVSVLLFSLLIGAGMGGLTSGRLSSNGLAKKTGLASIVAAVVLLLYALMTPIITGQFLGLTLMGRSLLSAVILIPLGFVLGFPFPLGIRLMREAGVDSSVPWMWGINGSASVLGSVLAIVLAMKAGFAWAMVVGVGCYLLAWLVARGAGHAVAQRAD